MPRRRISTAARRILAALLALWASLVAPAPLGAQEPVLRFERISIEDGLSHSSVNAVINAEGFIWIGTNDGLNRYDGHEVIVFKHDPQDPDSLSHSAITALLADSQGQLWVGTRNGLNAFLHDDHRSLWSIDAAHPVTRFLHDPADPNSISDNWIGSIAEDAQGRLWIGTRSGDVNRYDPQTGHFSVFRAAEGDVGGLIYKDRQGRIWLGNSAGLHLINTENGDFTRYQFDPTDPASDVYAIAEDHDGLLWVGTDHGVFAYDLATGTSTHYRHDPADPRSLSDDGVSFITVDPRNRVWVGTYVAGLNRLDRTRGDWRRIRHDPANPNSLSTDQIATMYIDRTDVYWIGTERGGLNLFNSASESLNHYTYDSTQPQNLSGKQINALLYSSANQLWVGTAGAGLNRMDQAAGSLQIYRAEPGGLHSDIIMSLYEDRAGAIWVSTYGGGLSRLDPRNDSFHSYRHDPLDASSLANDTVNRVLEGHDGTLWVGTEAGLSALDPATGRFRNYSADPDRPTALAYPDVSTLYEDATGTLWVGTYGGGLHRFDQESGTFTRYLADPEDPEGLSDGRISSIVDDGAGGMWIGTLGGLHHFDPRSGRFTRYDEANGLPSNTIMCVLPDNSGRLWLSTGRGLASFEPASGAVRVYNPRHGLQAYEFRGGACHRSHTGAMLFGGINGFNIFNPDHLAQEGQREMLVSISRLSVFNQPLTQAGKGNHIDLSYRDSLLTFDFAAQEYVQPEAVRYSYMLEGFDDDWIDAGNRRSATYTNLPGGTYRLLVRAAGPEGVWGPIQTSATIVIWPPPWANPVAYSLYAIAAGLGLWRFVRWRTHSALERRHQLERQVAERTAELSRANAALAASEAQFRSLVEQAPVGIVTVRDGALIDANPAALHMFGYARAEEMIGSLVVEHMPPGERVSEVARAMRAARGEPVEPARPIVGQRRDGSTFPAYIQSIGASLHGDTAAEISFITDTSALATAEEERDRFFTLAQDLLCIAGKDGYFKRLNPAWEAVLGLSVEALMAEPYLSFVHPDDRETTALAMRYAAGGNRLLSFENRYRGKDGTYHWLAWSYTLVPERRLFYGVARDISEQKRAEAEQRRLQAVAEGLRDVLGVINSNRPLPEVLDVIIAQATRLIGAEAGLVLSLQPGSDNDIETAGLHCDATSGFETPCCGIIFPPHMSVLSQQALRLREPVTHLAANNYASSFDHETVIEPHRKLLEEIKRRFGAIVAVPLLVEGQPYGTFVLYHSRGHAFSETDVRLASAMAEQSALAIQTARLREQLRHAAVAEERNRLARELHDAVTQSLYSMTLLAAGARFQAEEEGHTQQAEDFARLGEVAQQALGEMRLLIYELRPPVLETEGLVGAIQQRLETVERRAGLRARLLVEDEVELPPAVEAQLYRIVQEALNNVLKHAGARQVTVALRGPAVAGPGQIELTVGDDGRGFNGGAPRGIGLASMEERAAAIGGTTTIVGVPGAGTTVTVRVPIRGNR